MSRLPIFFKRSASLHQFAMVGRHADGVGEAQEIRRVQHEHMQRMALDPFAANRSAAATAARLGPP
jgi:hypothetical protein